MKNIKTLFLAGVILATGLAARAELPTEARQALRLAATDIKSALANAGSIPKDQPIALLPIRGDDSGYVIGVLKDALTGAGLQTVEGKEDQFVQEIFKEVEWDERKNDILDTNTLAKFGSLQGAKLLMYGFVREATGGEGRGFIELELHVSSIETKKHLWGDVFSKRFFDAQSPAGPVNLDPHTRAALHEFYDRVVNSLKASGKLGDVHSVLVVPLAGDDDEYMTGLMENAVTASQLSPKRLDVRTLADARELLRDDPKAADAIIFGAVRDISRRKLNDYPDRTEYEINSSVQMTIQKSPAGVVLWSDTVETSGKDVITVSWWEMVQKYGPAVLLHKKIILLPLLGFGALLVLVVLFRMMSRPR
jgi:hypothetical protein